MQNSRILTLLSLTCFACTPSVRELPEVPASIQSEEPKSGPAAHRWSYKSGPGGPDSWAGLPDSSCGQADQSPIDIPLDVLSARASSSASDAAEEGKESAAPSFMLSGTELPLVASNDRRIVALAGSAAVTLQAGSKAVPLRAVRLHAPAEHRLGGVQTDLEFEFSFEDEKARYALSLLFRRGAANPSLDALVRGLPEDHEYGPKDLKGALPLEKLVEGEDLLVYDGSMSAPPCLPTERLVLARVSELSSEQLERLLRALPHPSARPLGDLGTRVVHLASLSRSSSPSSVTSEKPAPTPSQP